MIRAVVALTVLMWMGGSPREPVQRGAGTASVTVPPTLSFQIPNISVATVATGPTTVSFANAIVPGAEVLRISVKADGNLTKAGAPSIAASLISWTVSGVNNGTGMNGVLSTSTYTPVFLGSNGKKSGSLNIAWTLAAPGTNVRAGTYQTTLRWKFEAVNP